MNVMKTPPVKATTTASTRGCVRHALATSMRKPIVAKVKKIASSSGASARRDVPLQKRLASSRSSRLTPSSARERQRAAEHRRDDPELAHQAVELLGVEALRTVRERLLGVVVDFDDEAVRPGGDRGARHRDHLLAPARPYSAVSSHSSIVAERPRFSSTGLRTRPSSLSRSKFCMLRAPTCRQSTERLNI